jgi:hypothetical protein
MKKSIKISLVSNIVLVIIYLITLNRNAILTVLWFALAKPLNDLLKWRIKATFSILQICWFFANNLMHAAVDNIYEFSKRFIGIFLKYLNEEEIVETSSEISSMLMFSWKWSFIIIDDIHSVVILYLHFQRLHSKSQYLW